MTETNQKILDMILKNATTNEISSATGLSNKQLFYRLNLLKAKGYNFSKKYYDDGEITYKLQKGIQAQKEISLITSPKNQQIRLVFISDLHLASIKDRVDLLNQVYEFCSKEGIHIIINSGDMVDGFLGYAIKKYTSFEQQIEYMLKVYPYDKNILNFTCLGNHEADALERTGQNLETILEIKRHDIIPLGYGIGKLKIKNDEIIIKHPKTNLSKNVDISNNNLVIYGHSHRAKTEVHENRVNLFVPTLSDLQCHQGVFPGFMKATIEFYNGIFINGNFEQYIMIDKIYKVNESSYDLYYGKDLEQKNIKYEEDRDVLKKEQPNKQKEKKLIQQNSRLSQIDKFNKRYNK